jgi:hypothetical protein
VPAQLAATKGKARKVVTKPSSKRRTTTKVLRLHAGRYRLTAERSVLNGVTYRPVLSARRVTVRSGKVGKVVARWVKEKPAARVRVTTSSSTSVTLAWTTAAGKRVMVRRASGEKAPRTASAGTKIASGKVRKVVDRGLAPGSRYAYSVFVRNGKRWSRPSSVTGGTIGVDPVTGRPTPSYSIATGAVVVDPVDQDRLFVRAGRIWVHLAPGRPAPVLGAGIALPISQLAPGGFLGRVVEIAADGRTVRLTPGTMPDVFDHYDISVLTEPGRTWTRTAPTGSRHALAGGSRTSARHLDEGDDGEDEPDPVPCLNGFGATESEWGIAVKLNEAPDIIDGGSKFDYEFHKNRIGIPNAVSFDMYTKPGIDMNVTVKASGSLSCVASTGEFKLPITITPIPMLLTWEMHQKFTAEAALEMTVDAAPTLKVGAKLRIGSDSDFDPVFDPSLGTREFSGKLEGGLSFVYGGGFSFGPGTEVGGIGARAGLEGEINVIKFGLGGSYDTARDPKGCLVASVDGEAALKLAASAWAGPFSIGAEKTIWDDSWEYYDPIKIPAGCVPAPPPSWSGLDALNDPSWEGASEAFVDLRKVTLTAGKGRTWPSVLVTGVGSQVRNLFFRVMVNVDSDSEPEGVYDLYVDAGGRADGYGQESRLWPVRMTDWWVRDLDDACFSWKKPTTSTAATLSFDPTCLSVSGSKFSVNVELSDNRAPNAALPGDVFPDLEAWTPAVALAAS